MNIDLDQGWKELEWFKSMMEGVGILTQIKDERTWNIDLNEDVRKWNIDLNQEWQELEYLLI